LAVARAQRTRLRPLIPSSSWTASDSADASSTESRQAHPLVRHAHTPCRPRGSEPVGVVRTLHPLARARPFRVAGARLLTLVALKRPDLVTALCVLNLTGGPVAADALAADYYHRFATLAADGGMRAVLASPFYAARLRCNEHSTATLRQMPSHAFVDAMRASAGLYRRTQHEPALALTATALATLTCPVLVVNTYGARNDGCHTPEVAHAVAAAVPGAEVVVSEDRRQWFPRVAAFISRNGHSHSRGDLCGRETQTVGYLT
jgi:hypothetical protein